MNEGRKITDLEQMESIPAGTSHLVEAGDGSGTKQLKHEKLVEEIRKGIGLGNLKELDTEEKSSVTAALNEVNKKAGTVFKGTDSIAEGAAGLVPAPKPDEDGYVLGANGKWVPPGEGGSVDIDILEDMEALEANTDKGKLVDALVVKEISDNLGGLNFYEDENGNKYVVGADSVPKKLGNLAQHVFFKGTCETVGNGQTSTFATYTIPENGDYHIVFYSVGFQRLGKLVIAGTTTNLSSYNQKRTLSKGQQVIGQLYGNGSQETFGVLSIWKL